MVHRKMNLLKVNKHIRNTFQTLPTAEKKSKIFMRDIQFYSSVTKILRQKDMFEMHYNKFTKIGTTTALEF